MTANLKNILDMTTKQTKQCVYVLVAPVPGFLPQQHLFGSIAVLSAQRETKLLGIPTFSIYSSATVYHFCRRHHDAVLYSGHYSSICRRHIHLTVAMEEASNVSERPPTRRGTRPIATTKTATEKQVAVLGSAILAEIAIAKETLSTTDQTLPTNTTQDHSTSEEEASNVPFAVDSRGGKCETGDGGWHSPSYVGLSGGVATRRLDTVGSGSEDAVGGGCRFDRACGCNVCNAVSSFPGGNCHGQEERCADHVGPGVESPRCHVVPHRGKKHICAHRQHRLSCDNDSCENSSYQSSHSGFERDTSIGASSYSGNNEPKCSGCFGEALCTSGATTASSQLPQLKSLSSVNQSRNGPESDTREHAQGSSRGRIRVAIQPVAVASVLKLEHGACHRGDASLPGGLGMVGRAGGGTGREGVDRGRAGVTRAARRKAQTVLVGVLTFESRWEGALALSSLFLRDETGER